jgi:(p)ppGpp synthase/HD superfamily hydrolase
MFTPNFDRALIFATELHREQTRKLSGVPYVSHLLAVAALVIEDGGSEDEAIAALLHDSIEDQAKRYPGGGMRLREDIRERFGPEVLRIVEACTEDYLDASPNPGDRRAQWRSLRKAYINHLRAADPKVLRVSCADSLHNVRSMAMDYRRLGDKIWERFRTRSRDDQLWAYDRLARAFLETVTGPLAGELNRAVDDLFRATGVERPA